MKEKNVKYVETELEIKTKVLLSGSLPVTSFYL